MQKEHFALNASRASRAFTLLPSVTAARRSLQQDAQPCCVFRHGSSEQGPQSEAAMRSTTTPAFAISLALSSRSISSQSLARRWQRAPECIAPMENAQPKPLAE